MYVIALQSQAQEKILYAKHWHKHNKHTHDFSFFFIHSLSANSRVGIWDAIQTELCFICTNGNSFNTTECPFVLFFYFAPRILHAKKRCEGRYAATNIWHRVPWLIWMYTYDMCTHCAKCDVYFLHETTLNNHWLRRTENIITNRLMFDV